MAVSNYRKLMDKLSGLSSCALLSTGRSGTDFLQSLLDSHLEVLTFNGHLFYHKFWRKSTCVAAGNFELSDFVDEFMGKHIEKLKSRYDIREGKDRLGDDCNQSLNINLNQFKDEIINLLNGREVNSRNSMLAIYAAYAICLGQDIEKKSLLFHHLHHFEELKDYLNDFPKSKIICMTRDPRANFVSGIEHWRRFKPSTDQGGHLHFYIKRILADATVLEKYQNKYIVVRVEDLGKEYILKELSKWLDISYNECLKNSTWAGLSWHGDRLSAKRTELAGWSEKILENNWQAKLSPVDKYVLNYIMFYRLRHYGYSYKKIRILDSFIMPFLIFFPMSYEWRFFSFGYIRNCLINREYSKIIKNVIYYLRRVCLFMNYYLDVTRRRKFIQPVFSSEWARNDRQVKV